MELKCWFPDRLMIGFLSRRIPRFHPRIEPPGHTHGRIVPSSNPCRPSRLRPLPCAPSRPPQPRAPTTMLFEGDDGVLSPLGVSSSSALSRPRHGGATTPNAAATTPTPARATTSCNPNPAVRGPPNGVCCSLPWQQARCTCAASSVCGVMTMH